MLAQPIIRAAIPVGVVFLVSFALNYVWEMLQMPFYEGMSFSDPSSYFRCLVAGIGDAAIVVGIFILGRILFRSSKWPQRIDAIKALCLALVGAGIAIVVEIAALNSSRWAYSPLMPCIPVLQVGLVPVVQLMILPNLSFFLMRRLCRQRVWFP